VFFLICDEILLQTAFVNCEQAIQVLMTKLDEAGNSGATKFVLYIKI